MWDEVFVRQDAHSGKDVAVVLLDTQGTFDNQTTMQMNALIFALAALLSSTMVYNVSTIIQEDVLQVCSCR